MKTALALLYGIAVAGQALAQTSPAAQHLPRGTATDISNAEVLATVQKTGNCSGLEGIRVAKQSCAAN